MTHAQNWHIIVSESTPLASPVASHNANGMNLFRPSGDHTPGLVKDDMSVQWTTAPCALKDALESPAARAD